MITAVDTSVLLDVLHGDRVFGPRSADAIRDALLRGSVIASEIVWAETTAAVGATTVGDALVELGVVFQALDQHAATNAGAAWALYRARGGKRTRIVSDFLIGAHAGLYADCLLTRDRGFFRTYFKALDVIEP